MHFNLESSYKPTGDQPQAIKELVAGINAGQKAQTLVGVTGSGKTFTAVNVICEVQRPTLIICHNKTLAAQIYAEVRDFFPSNAVEYFVSYYDYYQPEAYIPSTNVYIEKDLAINEEIERLRSRAIAALLSGRRDVVVVASVSCIYGLSDPSVLQACVRSFRIGDTIERDAFLLQLVELLYKRNETGFTRGSFRVRGDVVDVFPIHETHPYRFCFFGDRIETMHEIDVETGACISNKEEVTVFPMSLFVADQQHLEEAIAGIEKELDYQVMFFLKQGCLEEADRLQERTRLDIDMMRELGYCSGIENYSRFFDKRKPGEPSYCLLDYFPKDFLVFVDESHVSIPQIRGMWGGDHARKKNLVKYGFRVPAAMDNRPLTLDEFQSKVNQVIYVSATPADYELNLSDGVITEQLIRPTWILDPLLEVHPSKNQIDHLLNEVRGCIGRGERVLVMTTTKKFAEELAKYLTKRDVLCRYLHSEIKTLDRVKILEDLRTGFFDVLVGVNLLREGLDLPEVALVAILDADKEGFLRNFSSLMQMGGRAARHVHGRVLLYADKMTPSLRRFIDETERRRKKQEAYNQRHNVTPTGIKKGKSEFSTFSEGKSSTYKLGDPEILSVAEAEFAYVNDKDVGRLIKRLKKRIEVAAGAMDYIKAQKLQEELGRLKTLQAHRRAVGQRQSI